MTEESPDPTAAARRELLARIQSPADLKALPEADLPQLCDEVREFLLDTVQETGGHLGSNLGVVELATALHYLYDFKRDRLIWDVSHQCYPHKVLTGRREGFKKLRMSGGMCGFTNPHESEYDLFHTGHAGTSVSLGLGLALAHAHEADPPHVVSVIGDASLGAGVAFEAINHAGATGNKLLVVLNDNEWSISKSVGAMARYLSRIRSTRLVQRAQQEIQNLINAIPLIGPKVEQTLEQVGEVVRHAIVPGHVFEELGVTYVGPIDGHNVGLLTENLRRIRQLDGVVLLHILTHKGKGHPDAPTHPERVHAAKPRSKPRSKTAREKAANLDLHKVPGQVKKAPEGPAFTKAFGDAVVALAERDLRVHAITAAMPSGTGLSDFAKRFPGRFHDTGITEQHAVAMSAGMAKGGLRPITAIYSTFLQRGFDQVFQEVCLQGLPVTFCLDRAGLVGQDGPTHNGVFDLAYLRSFPGIVLCAPRDEHDMRRMLELGLKIDRPVALRYPRDTCPAEPTIDPRERREMEPGKAEVLLDGPEKGGLVIWAYGALVKQSLQAAERLRQRGVQVGLVDARFCKPLDEELLAEHARRYRHIVTVEEHQRSAGFGSAVLEVWNRVPQATARVKILGIPDRFTDHMSSRDEQLAEVGLDADGIERVVRNLLQPTLV